MDADLKKQIESRQDAGGFIKVTDEPVSDLTSQQKVALNRKANALFNEGKIAMAQRIFITTGYSDGLTRCGDKALEQNRPIDALKLYLLAHNKRKSEPLIEKLSGVLSMLLRE